MFSTEIINSDSFCEISFSAQTLFLHLLANTDDDGFVSQPRGIQRMCNCSDDDFKELEKKGVIIPFKSGVIVFADWRIHNLIRQDRKKETLFQDELSELEVKKNGAYQLKK